MQTFLPYANIEKTVKCLDWRRLGKQRVESKQILNAIHRGKGGWSNHPATKMWKGYENGLTLYMNYCIKEWIQRGYKNNMPIVEVEKIVMPPWFGDEKFHSSHRSNLLEKDFEWYSKFGWTEEPGMPYVWPVR